MLTVRSSKKDSITFPENLLKRLGVKEGEKVDVKVKKGSLTIVKESEEFFALEGALKDVDIEGPIEPVAQTFSLVKALCKKSCIPDPVQTLCTISWSKKG